MKRYVFWIYTVSVFVACLSLTVFKSGPCFSFEGNLLPRIEIPSSPNPVGSGARALGMGGAFIAVADDATAASWNPGGLNQLDLPEISFVGDGFHRIEDNSFRYNPEAEGNQTVSMAHINYLSLACPFSLWERNMIVALNYQNLYDFTRKWDFSRTLVNSMLKM
jgi:hypothetical protein